VTIVMGLDRHRARLEDLHRLLAGGSRDGETRTRTGDTTISVVRSGMAKRTQSLEATRFSAGQAPGKKSAIYELLH